MHGGLRPSADHFRHGIRSKTKKRRLQSASFGHDLLFDAEWYRSIFSTLLQPQSIMLWLGPGVPQPPAAPCFETVASQYAVCRSWSIPKSASKKWIFMRRQLPVSLPNRARDRVMNRRQSVEALGRGQVTLEKRG